MTSNMLHSKDHNNWDSSVDHLSPTSRSGHEALSETCATTSTGSKNIVQPQAAASGGMFTQARNVNISGGHFSISHSMDMREREAQEIEIERRRRLEEAIKLLRSNATPRASYDCAERSDVPTCHPETREAIIANIRKWVASSETRQRFLWMYGPAGCGKTTIAETVAEMCDEEDLLAGSFFFSRSGNNRPRDSTQFVATVVDQLCISIPEMRDYVAVAIDHDPRIFSKTLFKQIDRLLIGPLNQVSNLGNLQNAQAARPRLVVVDGLDECEGAQSQVEVLEGLEAAATRLLYPMVFLVSSRPEHSIRSTFASESMSSLTQGMPLDNDYQADADIKKFLTSRFEQIRKKHPGAPYLPTNWPSSEDLQYLIEKSSGQFIYPSVVMKWVESTHNSPVLRLEEILKLSSSGTSKRMPFEQLDMLYSHVLSTLDPDNLAKALEIISWMILDSETGAKTFDAADRLFSYHPGVSRIVLTGLSALIYLPEIQPNPDPVLVLASGEDVASVSGSLPTDPSAIEELQNSSSQLEYPIENTSSSEAQLNSASEVGSTSRDTSMSEKVHNEASAIGVSESSESSPYDTDDEAFVSRTTSSLRFFHASFPDFLVDRSRSGNFFIYILSAHRNLATHWMKYYSKYTIDPPRSAKEQDGTGLNSLDVTRAIFSHCASTTMTPDLQDDLYTLDLQPVLSIVDPTEYWWRQALLILNFILWLEGQLLPNPQKDLFQHYLQNATASIQVYWSTYRLDARKYLPISLTFPSMIGDRDGVWFWQLVCIIDLVIGVEDNDPLNLITFQRHDIEDSDMSRTPMSMGASSDELFLTTKVLLCRILTNFELSMSGNYFGDPSSYTQLATLVAQSYFSHINKPPEAVCKSGNPDNAYYLGALLPIYLTKAPPDANLAMLLRDQGLQLNMVALERTVSLLSSTDVSGEDIPAVLRRLALANLLHVKQSGMPFRDHTHCPEFAPNEWYCVICDTEHSEDELSSDPVPEPTVEVVPRQGFIQGRLMVHFAPLLEMIRIRIWIAWLAEILRRMLVIR